MDSETLQTMLQTGMPGADVTVEGDDGRHFHTSIVWSGFAGMNTLRRHQAVYQVLGEAMREAIHALSMKTLTPEEYRPAQNG